MGTKPTPITKKRSANGQAEQSSWSELLSTQDMETCSWAWADPEELTAAVVSATEDGAAVLLSKTSDGGALCVQVWHGIDRFKLYPSSAEELAVVLMHIQTIGRAQKHS